MIENYNYPDTHEMFELHDILEELLSKGEYSMRLGEGAKVYADPSLVFTPGTFYVSACSMCHLSLWGSKEYEHILEDIQNGTYQSLSVGDFEEKRKEWIEDIKKTEHPMLRIVKAIKYSREVDAWEIKRHFLSLVAKKKGLLISTEVCGNMIRKGYSLSQIAEIVPWVTKADIYGLSHMLENPLELTEEERREVETEYRKTGDQLF